MTFINEAEFEKALIKVLRDKGWGEHDVIKNPTEEQLLENWAKILFENNKGIDRLNNIPLTHSEMQQILEQIITPPINNLNYGIMEYGKNRCKKIITKRVV